VTHFSIRYESDSGQSVVFVPRHVKPLGLGMLRSLLLDNKAAVGLEMEAENPLVNGAQQTGIAKVKAKIVFNEPPTIYALLHGGWLPLPFAMPQRFLVDRNVVISLSKIRRGDIATTGEVLQWWLRFFAQGTALFNPLPYAFEAGFRRKPTMTEFVAAYKEGAEEIHQAVPSCGIVRFSKMHYRDVYALLEAFDRRSNGESKFLQEVCSLVLDRVPRKKEREIAIAILSTADRYGLSRASLVVLAVLSCLYEDVHGNFQSIGRLLIKPKKIYTEADAFNALSDLRHVELAAAGQVYFQREAFALCTCDRAIALLWCALSLRGESPAGVGVEFTFDLTKNLFPRLGDSEIYELKALLNA
jgi:hypothetical protein